MADSRTRREELRWFLTTRRQRISPQEAGLATIGRRRRRGLTREDVAQFTGVSFKWYTLLESGAAPGVSRRFLDRVANVLRVNRAERRHLFSLFGFAEADENEDAGAAPESLRRLVDELAGAPAAVYSATFDVLPEAALTLNGNSVGRRAGDGPRGGAVNGAPHRAERPVHSRPGSFGHALRTAS